MAMAVQRRDATGQIAVVDGSKPTDMYGERESNTHRAYREVRQRILLGEMPPGAQYLEQELAEMLGMSRTPVREALIRLADERLVEVRPRHGARVRPISIDDFREIYEMWAELESLATRRLASVGLTSLQQAALEEAQARMATALQADDRHEWFAAKRAFHATIVNACGNYRLIQVVQGLVDQSHRARQCTIEQYVIPERSLREHREIADALKACDPEMAARLVRQHRLATGAALAELLAATVQGG